MNRLNGEFKSRATGEVSISNENKGLIENCNLIEGSSVNAESATQGPYAPICITNRGIINKCINYADIESLTGDNRQQRLTEFAGITINNYGIIANCINNGKIVADKGASGITINNEGGYVLRCIHNGSSKTGRYSGWYG